MSDSGPAYSPRLDTGRLLEPCGTILHGAGQSPPAFADYCARFAATPPCISMYYCGLKKHPAPFFERLAADLALYPTALIPQIGLSMTHDGHPEERYEHEVARGDWDAHLDAFLDGLAALDRPVMLRIGYEFNGHWNGYRPDTYRAAWHRIHERLRGRGLDRIALVWCLSPEGRDPDFMAYYPGDDAVDWWSIDLFSNTQFDQPETAAFMAAALDHRFPVLIGESTARFVGVADAEVAWRDWFGRYFAFLAQHPHVKGFCYINWDWASYPQWHDWGDCRVTANPALAERYARELAHPVFAHLAGPGHGR